MMKWLTHITCTALLLSAAHNAWAEDSEATRRLLEAVRRSQAGSEIRPQVTDEQQNQAAAASTPTAPGTDQGPQSELARLLQEQQAQRQRNQRQAPQRTQAKSAKPTRPTIQQEAFSDMTSTTLPLNADQITTLKRLFNKSQRAAAQHPDTPPRPTSTSIMVDLSPGATPPIIRLASGFVTSLVFVDATGAPWPIAAYDLGDPRSYNIQWDKKGNTLMLQAITQYKSGNLAVVLKGMHTPIMLTLLPGQRAVDYRVDLRMPGLGPNAKTFVTSLPSSGNALVLNILNGVPPSGARRLTVSGGDAEAWLYANRLYLRTRLTILSPGWMATMSSGDGLHAYELQQTPVILASFHGKLVKLIVEGL